MDMSYFNNSNNSKIVSFLITHNVVSPRKEQYSIFYLATHRLDELLDGGLYTGELTEIVGAAGAGKSQVSHIALINHIQNNVLMHLLLHSKSSFHKHL